MSDEVAYEALLDSYAALVGNVPDLELKGRKMPYTSMNGNMFSFLAVDGTLCLRLSPADCSTFMQIHGTEPVKQYGSVMRDYVAVPEEVMKDKAILRALFQKCVANAQTLKAKSTKR